MNSLPQDELMRWITAKWASQAIGVCARLGVADHLAVEPKTAVQLALNLGVHPGALYRVMRAAASVGVFSEDEEGRFTLTPMAELLRSDVPGSLRALAIAMNLDATWRPYGQILHSVTTGKPAFEYVFGMNAFEYFSNHSEEAAFFGAAGAALTGRSVEALLRAYDFSRFKTWVDLGGGTGYMLAALLKAHPESKGILFEKPSVVAEAKALLEAERVGKRAEVLAGNFFDKVPEGGGAYLIKCCLNNWSDRNALRILENIRRATSLTAPLLVVESVVPRGNEPHYSKLSDVGTLVMTEGREREEEEWRELLEAGGFRVVRVIPTASPFSIIEAYPRD